MRTSLFFALAVAGIASAGFGKLLPVEIYEKGGGDVDRADRYSVQERVRNVPGEFAGCKLSSRVVKVTNLSNETRTFQVAVRAATAFKPTNWVIPGVIYGDNKFGSQVSPSGLERDGEPWVFGYDRESIPRRRTSCSRCSPPTAMRHLLRVPAPSAACRTEPSSTASSTQSAKAR